MLIVLVVVAILSLCAAASLDSSRNQYRAASRAGRRMQSQRLAESGVEFLKAYLAQPNADLLLDGGLLDNPQRLQAAVVVDATLDVDRGRFTVISPSNGDGALVGVRYGLEDESSRLHVNALLADPQNDAPRKRLLALPSMTNEIADAILDWIDADDQPRSFGAEADYYQGLDPPYAPRNGPLASIDELLSVRGVSPELLYGLDRNRNYVVDAHETANGDLLEADNTNGVFNRGWAAYLTLHSAEAFQNPDGKPRVNVNGQSLQDVYNQLASALGDEEAKFIVLYRQFGPQGSGQDRPPNGRQDQSSGDGAAAAAPSTGGPSSAGDDSGDAASNAAANGAGQRNAGELVSAASITINFEQQGQRTIGSLLDLIGTELTIPAQQQQASSSGRASQQPQQPAPDQGPQQQQQGEMRRVASPWPASGGSYEDLLKLYDHAVASPATVVAGRINVNTASRTVLAALPDIELALVDQIVARRDAVADPFDPTNRQRHAVWLFSDQIWTLEQMKRWEPYVTAYGGVWRCQVAGFFDADSTVVRGEAILDRLQSNVRLVTWEDLQGMGPGFSAEALGAQPIELTDR